ncbi:hypothetical protein N2601_16925 [Rhizobium sp. CB3060]|uniref:hypothetical protein n=1 Tax=Rhizobium sp. CB3060 TaxID=3138255 RepID=UPI0021A5EB90|nr:hypothetical protein [Rhizobium tropici]UWU20924.1 hypothetical protein N2601_16925 [Rhizobium tropici]
MTMNNRKVISMPGKKATEGAEHRHKSDNPNLIEQLNSLRAKRAKRLKMNRAAQRQEIVDACELGVSLMADSAMWHEFCEADWSGIRNPPQLNERHKAVFFAIKYMCGPGDEAQSEASFYFGAVDELVQLGVLGDELRDAIKRYGLKNLNDERRARAKMKALPPSEDSSIAWEKYDAISQITAQLASRKHPDENRFLKALPHEQKWEREHPTRFWFDVQFPFDPKSTFEEPLPDTFMLYVKITRFGEKCAMDVLKFQRHKENRRIGRPI